ncbi:MAG: hypothetical protein H5T68_06005 [Chloroflexi bacterium]|nr:hypothetical protein [Chloroflexota bacterium]
MKPYWLVAIPLLGAGIVWMTRRWRVLVTGLGLASMLFCAYLVVCLPLGEVIPFLGQIWSLDRNMQPWLLFMYGITVVLLVIAASTEQVSSFSAPALASVGLFSAVILLRSWMSFLLVPAALAVLALAVYPSVPAAVRAASRYLTCVSLPIPFFLAISILLDRFALFPDEVSLANWGAWLVIPPIVLWLTLFPIHWTTLLWAKGNPPLAPAFLWTVKDWIVIFFFLALWQQMPFLRTENTMAVLGSLGVLTVVFSGAWAVLQSSPSAVLGCAAMSALGIAVQGIAVGSDEALAGAISVLIHRGIAILLASSALAALYSSINEECAAKERSFSWPGLALLLIFLISVLALAVLPLYSHFGGGQHTAAALQARESRLMQAWWVSSVGIVIGLARTSWQLWRDKVRVSAKPISIPVLVAICLFLLWLWLESSPSLIWGWVSRVIAPFLPL